jgi:hypothetical protein
MSRPTVEYASTVWDPSNPKKDQIHRTGTEKSSKICVQQLHRPNTRLCHKYGKIFKMAFIEYIWFRLKNSAQRRATQQVFYKLFTFKIIPNLQLKYV